MKPNTLPLLCAVSYVLFSCCLGQSPTNATLPPGDDWHISAVDLKLLKKGDTVNDVIRKIGLPMRPEVVIPRWFMYYADDQKGYLYAFLFDHEDVPDLHPEFKLKSVVLTKLSHEVPNKVVWSSE